MHVGEDNEVFMTPEDFVRSLTPGKIQPAGKEKCLCLNLECSSYDQWYCALVFLILVKNKDSEIWSLVILQNVYSSRNSPYSPTEGIGNSWGAGVSQRQKKFKEMYGI